MLLDPSGPLDLVVIGHVTQDLTDGRPRPGGTGAYAALVASRSGLRTGLITCSGPELNLAELLPDVRVVLADSTRTTVMGHLQDAGRRVQFVQRRAGDIDSNAVPVAWRQSRLLLLAPLLGEVDPGIAEEFPRAVVFVAAQGWLRRVLPDGRVEDGNVGGLQVDVLRRRAIVLSLSEVDLAGAAVPQAWQEAFPIIIITRGGDGLRLRYGGQWWQLDAFPTGERDATGAGDALAAAFLARYSETADVAEAARFGAATASFVVEAPGLDGVPSRAAVERRLVEYPDIRLRPDG